MQRLPRFLVALSCSLVAVAASLADGDGRQAAAAATPPPVEQGTARGSTAAFRLVRHTGLSFSSPVWVGGAGDGTSSLYVAEQGGIVWKVTSGRKARFLDLRSVVLAGGEQGLLSIAFAHDFRSSGRMFAYYVARDADGRVRQFRVRNGRVVAGSGRHVLRVPLSPAEETNHNGGNLWAAPGGLLYLSIGDGGGSGDPTNNAQDLGRLMGKLIRITPRLDGGYAIPRGNPFTTRAGARPEIYALGLRNPWRFSIDAPTGDIWIGDVGQGEHEEVNRLVRGGPARANLGWRRMEGNAVYEQGTRLTAGTRYVRPVHTYGHGGGGCSITGGVVYRGPVAALRGRYLFADFCTDTVTALAPASGRAIVGRGASGVVHFGAGAGGAVFAASQQTGHIYRIAAG